MRRSWGVALHRCIVLVILGVVPSLAEAAVQQTKALLSAGGARMSGGAHVANGNVGDVAVGLSHLGATLAEHGFWAGNLHELVGVDPVDGVPRREGLGAPVPNPARSAISMGLELPTVTRVTVRAFDVSGRMVRELIDGVVGAGVTHVGWDLRRRSGTRVPAGLYFVRMETTHDTHFRRLVVLD
jgi:hypothetical protein